MAYSTELYQPDKNAAYDVLSFRTEKEWLDARKNGIGGSDSAAVLGLTPYKTKVEIYQEKVGVSEPEDISKKPAVIYGKSAEEPLRRLFQLDHPELIVNYKNKTILRNREYPFLLFSPDGLLKMRESGCKGIFENKTTTVYNRNKLSEWDNHVPDYYFSQIMHGLIVTEFEFVYLRALIKFPDGDSQIRNYYFSKSDFEKDINYIKTEEINFWNNHIRINCKPEN